MCQHQQHIAQIRIYVNTKSNVEDSKSSVEDSKSISYVNTKSNVVNTKSSAIKDPKGKEKVSQKKRKPVLHCLLEMSFQTSEPSSKISVEHYKGSKNCSLK